MKKVYKNNGVIKASITAANKNNGTTNISQNIRPFFISQKILFHFQFQVFFSNKWLIFNATDNDNKIALISKIQCGKIISIVFKIHIFSTLKFTIRTQIKVFENSIKIHKKDKKNQDRRIKNQTNKLFLNIIQDKSKELLLIWASIYCLVCSIKVFFIFSSIGK